MELQQSNRNSQGDNMIKKGIRKIIEKQATPISKTFNDEYGTNVDEYEQQLKKCQSSNQKFEDKDFKPDIQSLSQNSFADFGEKRKQTWGQIEWKRPEQFMIADQIQLFEGEVEPNDIKQGLLGDCYFLCALSAMAEHPELIRRLFHNEKNEFGIYSIWLNIFGEWQNVVIDDLIPVKGQGPAFSRAHGPELWVILLEKAYAKVYGSYEIIEGGNPAVALRDLTGAPYENLDRNPNLSVEQMAQKYWNYVTSNDKSGYIMTCYTESTQVVEEENDLGLLAGHAYSILDARSVKDNQGQPAQIFQIRNPWGRKEWTGDWSDKSEKWTEEWKKKCNIKDEDDGTFWISIQDFAKYYYGVGICKVNNGYQYNSIRLDVSETDYSIIKFTITEESHSFIVLNQKDDKFFMNEKDFTYSYLRLIVGKFQGDSLKYIGGKFIQDRELYIEDNLQPGDYIIFAETLKCHSTLKDLVINTYSEKQIKLEYVVGQDADQILLQLLKGYAKTKPQTQQNTKHYNNNMDLYRQQFNCMADLGLMFSYYCNSTNDLILLEKITMNQLQGLDIAPPFKQTADNSQKIQLPPDSEIVKVYKYTAVESGKTAYSSSITSDVQQYQKNIVDNKILLQPFTNNQDLKTRKNQSAAQRKNEVKKSLEDKRKQFEGYTFNISDDQPVVLKPFEQSCIQFVESKSSGYIQDWANVTFILTLVYIGLSLLMCLITSFQFLDLTIYLILTDVIIKNKMTQHLLRKFQYVMYLSFALQLYWLFKMQNHQNSWISNIFLKSLLFIINWGLFFIKKRLINIKIKVCKFIDNLPVTELLNVLIDQNIQIRDLKDILYKKFNFIVAHQFFFLSEQEDIINDDDYLHKLKITDDSEIYMEIKDWSTKYQLGSFFEKEQNALHYIKEAKQVYGNGVSLLLVIKNQTSKTLKLEKETIQSGYWHLKPQFEIPPNLYCIALFVHPDGQPAGVKGSIEYRIMNDFQGEHNTYQFQWDVPWQKVWGGQNSYKSSGSTKYVVQGSEKETSPLVQLVFQPQILK